MNSAGILRNITMTDLIVIFLIVGAIVTIIAPRIGNPAKEGPVSDVLSCLEAQDCNAVAFGPDGDGMSVVVRFTSGEEKEFRLANELFGVEIVESYGFVHHHDDGEWQVWKKQEKQEGKTGSDYQAEIRGPPTASSSER